jgi:tripartite-type tricarboxylate transporter receptor subunit TctC
MLRRRALLATSAILPLSATMAQTTLPNEAIDIVVGLQSTGGLDVVARRIAAELERRTGRRVGVENRPGDAGAQPGETLKRQPPDGTALALFASVTFAAWLIDRGFPFDPVAELAPVGLVGTWPIGLAVSPAVGVKTFDAYVDWLKSGSAPHRRIGNPVSGPFVRTFDRIFSREMGVPIESVPYRSVAALANDLADGRLPAAVSGIASLLEHHRGGRLRLLMITAPERLAIAPEIPTAREVGLTGLPSLEWYGFFVRSGTPQPLIDEWNRQINSVLRDSRIAGEFEQMGVTIAPSTPQELAAHLDLYLKEWRARMIAAGLQPVH